MHELIRNFVAAVLSVARARSDEVLYGNVFSKNRCVCYPSKLLV